MGAGQVGFQLAGSLSQEGHHVTVIECNADARARVEEELDVLVVCGNGAQGPVLESAQVRGCDLFMAVSSQDEANLAAALMAKRLGAKRTVVRLESANDVVGHRDLYEEVFRIDLLFSTQMLTTTRILNHVRGLNTVAVEHFADGKVQLRKISLEADSLLTQRPLAEIKLPAGSLVVAFFRGDELIIPGGNDRAEPGDEALILGKTEVINRFERMVTSKPARLGDLVIAGGGAYGRLLAQALEGLQAEVKLIEKDRQRARQLAEEFPRYQVFQGDATDLSLLKAEHIERASCFIAVTGHDETNLMATMLASELGVPQMVALVDRAETSHLWRKVGLGEVFSPRALANERIHEYIDSGYSANIVSLRHGAAQVLERRLYEASPAAGVTLAEMQAPRGLIVGAVVRGNKVFVPAGQDRLEAGDVVTLFVREEELDTVQLLFPGRDLRPGSSA